MNIAVLGMWHLGTVVAGCLAAAGHCVVGFDRSREAVGALNQGKLPVSEPGLEEMIRTATGKGLLRFSHAPEDLLSSNVVWAAYDTPVDDEDRADVDFVLESICSLFACIRSDALVVVSSQLPVGSVRALEKAYRRVHPDGAVSFACLPENLRLGKAISVFMNPDRIVAGVRSERDRELIERMLKPISGNIVWMSVESAEMTKHAINAFLATSVAFANELATICEHYRADASEVERGLKSDMRIGAGAYLKPGSPFAGGTLARDVAYLLTLGKERGLPTPLVSGVLQSNNSHRLWARRRLTDVLGSIRGVKVAVLGLTYKPGTDTLRRSDAVETCRWLNDQGAVVSAFDPVVGTLPEHLHNCFSLAPSALDALKDAHAAIVATGWPQFQAITAGDVLERMERPVVLDPGRFLESSLGNHSRIRYITVGSPS